MIKAFKRTLNAAYETAILLLPILSIGYVTYLGYEDSVINRNNRLRQQEFFYQQQLIQSSPLMNYVDNNLERIIKRQETALNIKYESRPRIRFESINANNTIHSNNCVALYSLESQEIIMNLDLIRVPASKETPSPKNHIQEYFKINIDEVLDHELFHHYINTLEKKLLISQKQTRPGSFKNQKDKFAWLISQEGMAQYIQFRMNDKKNHFTDHNWPNEWKDLDEINNFNSKKNQEFVMYSGGAYAMAPILEYDSKGIEYIVKNRPSEKDLYDHFKSYQERALHSLKSN